MAKKKFEYTKRTLDSMIRKGEKPIGKYFYSGNVDDCEYGFSCVYKLKNI